MRMDVTEEQLSVALTELKELLHSNPDLAFDKAKKVYESILASHPNDGPSYVYLDRCQEFLTSPPPINWDGVHIMETK